MLIFYVNSDIWSFIEYVQDLVDICSHANKILKIFDKRPNVQINIENQRVRYFGLAYVLSVYMYEIRISYRNSTI